MIALNVWGEIIKDFQETQLPNIVERELEFPLETPLKRAIALIGPRRAGKTYMMFQAIERLIARDVNKSRILYVNFEDNRLPDVSIHDLNNMLEVFFEIYPENKKQRTWIFLDEIQLVARWETFVRRLIDNEDIQVIVTGSSSKMMSKEIATSLRGRSLSYEIFPFSFKEYLAAYGISCGKYLTSEEKAKVINSLRTYIQYGGYPETVIYQQERERILREIIDVTIYRDIIERHKVKNSKVLRLFLSALLNAKEFSVHKFFNFLKSQGVKISKNTLYTYLGYFCDSLVVHPLHKFSHSYKNAEGSIPKIYFVDNGLLHSRGITDNGRLMENLVFIELYRQHKEISYYRSLDDKEVDFVIKEGRKIKHIIQACYDISDYSTKERETKALLKASKELKCANLQIITWDREGEEKTDSKRIIYTPLWKWLCKEHGRQPKSFNLRLRRS